MKKFCSIIFLHQVMLSGGRSSGIEIWSCSRILRRLKLIVTIRGRRRKVLILYGEYRNFKTASFGRFIINGGFFNLLQQSLIITVTFGLILYCEVFAETLWVLMLIGYWYSWTTTNQRWENNLRLHLPNVSTIAP